MMKLEEKLAYVEVGIQPNPEGILDVSVSFDGSWQKHGFTPQNGTGCIIDLLTGLRFD